MIVCWWAAGPAFVMHALYEQFRILVGAIVDYKKLQKLAHISVPQLTASIDLIINVARCPSL